MQRETAGIEPAMRDLIMQSRAEVMGGGAAPPPAPSGQPDGQRPEEPALQRTPPPPPPANPDALMPRESAASPAGSESAREDEAFTRMRPDELPPELREYYRSMQGDYTRSKQEIAEQRRAVEALQQQYGGIPEATLELARTVEQLAQTDPLAAADMLIRHGSSIKAAMGQPAGNGEYGAPPAGGIHQATQPYWTGQGNGNGYGDDTYSGDGLGVAPAGQFQPQTDVEAHLYQMVQQSNARLDRWEQMQEARQIQAELADVDRMAGQPLGLADKAKLLTFAKGRGVTLPEAYRLLHHDQLLQAAIARARDEGRETALQLAGLPPTGGGIAPRESAPPEPTDPKEIARLELRRLSGR